MATKTNTADPEDRPRIPSAGRALLAAATWLLPVLLARAPNAQQFEVGQLLTGQAPGVASVRTADVDGDGDQDVLSASPDDDKIAWYENEDGQGSFGLQRIITTSADGALSVFAVDLDGDGDQDVLSASSNDDEIAWYENEDGQGSFGSARVVTAAADDARSVFAADLDGDGDQDVLAAFQSGGGLAWYENEDGRGSFGPERAIATTAGKALVVRAADLDGDGDQDVLAVRSNQFVWFENEDGRGTFGSEQVVAGAPDFAWCVSAADLDGDGDQDMLSSSGLFLPGEVAWYENEDGQGSFGPPQPVSTDGLDVRWVSAADLDGDGDQDVLAASFFGREFTWFENEDGLGGFGPPQVFTSLALEPRSIVAADLDGDGDQDVVSAASGNGRIAWYENEDGLGGFGPEQLLTHAAYGAVWTLAADLDGDADLDVLSVSRDDDKIAWHENVDGLGLFGPQRVITQEGVGPWTAVAADVDGDGDQDVVSASTVDDRIAWCENEDGHGRFGPQQLVSTAADGPVSIFSADLDGDGDPDLLSASWYDDEIAWYENEDGLGGFGPQRIVSTAGDVPWSVFAADLDGDGDLDVLSASAADDEIAWYENEDGRGSFGPQRLVSTSADYARSVFAADLDGDGDQDVLSASSFDDKIAWYENEDGRGSFGPERIISTSADYARSVFAADLDGDGDRDVLSASSLDDRIAWYENLDGSGTFGPLQLVSNTADDAQSVFAADLDGDGDQDVLSASLVDGKIAWYRNQVCCALSVDASTLSLTAGGTQVLALDAGSAQAAELYWLLSTSAGASPGEPLAPAPLKLPLNFSPLLRTTAFAPNVLVVASFDVLDGDGRAAASLTLPPGLDPSLAGITLHHAYLVVDTVTFGVTGISNAVPLTLVP